jgi:hypothetical protein
MRELTVRIGRHDPERDDCPRREILFDRTGARPRGIRVTKAIIEVPWALLMGGTET